MKTPEREIFYVGYLPVPLGLRRFLPAVALIAVAAFAGLGFAVSSTQRDPGSGSFRWDLGRQELTGVLVLRPYPTLTLTEAAGDLAAGRTVMLSGPGKRGVQDRAEGQDGALVTAAGIRLARGALDMLQTGRIDPAEGTATPPRDVPVGRWRITGEICDGKCYAGAMRPGTGLAHKACANLCLIGGIPPVLVATDEVLGSRFLMLGEAGGGPAGDWLLDHVARLVEIEGEVVRRGDLLILLADPASVRPL